MKVDNPVAPPPPPRTSYEDSLSGDPSPSTATVRVLPDDSAWGPEQTIPTYDEISSEYDADDRFERTAGQSPAGQSLDSRQPRQDEPASQILSSGEVAAKVNGAPIFAADVLDPFAGKLEQLRLQAPPEVYEENRRQLIEHTLGSHIERKLLSDALKTGLEKEQLDGINQRLEEMFQQWLTDKMEERNISSQTELQRMLQVQHTTLDAWQRAFNERELAQQYILFKVGTKPKFSRRKLWDYYHDHLDEYAVIGKVKWQEIVIDYDKHGGRRQARQVAEQLMKDHQHGADFGELAAEFSHGPTAGEQGHWDWTEEGSLSDAKLEKLLFSMPVGSVSGLISGPRSFQIVKLLDRVEPGTTPFADVYDKIAQELRLNDYRQASRKILGELKANAVIETEYDYREPDDFR